MIPTPLPNQSIENWPNPGRSRTKNSPGIFLLKYALESLVRASTGRRVRLRDHRALPPSLSWSGRTSCKFGSWTWLYASTLNFYARSLRVYAPSFCVCSTRPLMRPRSHLSRLHLRSFSYPYVYSDELERRTQGHSEVSEKHPSTFTPQLSALG